MDRRHAPHWRLDARAYDECGIPSYPGFYSPGVSVEGLWLSSELRDGSMVVSIRGDLDIVTSGQLDEQLTQARAASSRVILDLAGVDFMDTSALAVIVGHWKTIESGGGMLALAGARYRYTKTLWITGLADRLTLYESVDQALRAGQHPDGHDHARPPDRPAK